MKNRRNIILTLLKALKTGVLSLILCLCIAFGAKAANIVCGDGHNSLCDIEKRQCVKVPGAGKCIETTTMSASGGVAVSVCVKRGDDYRCIGKNEEKPKGATNVTFSTNGDGKILIGDEEKIALEARHQAEYTEAEKKEIIKEAYANEAEVKVDDIKKEVNAIQSDKQHTQVTTANKIVLREAIEKLQKYTTEEGYNDAVGSPGDTRLLDTLQDAMDALDNLKTHMTDEQYYRLKTDINALYKTAVNRTAKTAGALNDTKTQKKLQEELADAVMEYGVAECPTSEQLRARYNVGCWSCLVLEKLTSSFLWAANAGLAIVQKAGLTLLWLGTAIWLVLWGLKNVSSFTQIELGNILNDLIKFLFKVAIAYWFIIYSSTAISQYLITPMMSVGAIIGQQFWPQEIEEFTEDYDEAFEPDDPKKADEMAEEVEKNNPKGLGGTNAAGETPTQEEDTTGGTGIVEEPTPVKYDSTEAVVQDLQKAFINILRKQLKEIQNSCGSVSCLKIKSGSNYCKYASCNNAGHQNYIKSIMSLAGYGARVDHYCQASITAAMVKLTQAVGAKENILKKAGASCSSGIGMGAVGDILLCDKGRQVYKNINVGDTIYYHNVVKQGGNGQKVGGGSGHHAVTYSGSGKTISFNGDGEGSLCNSYYYNVWGKVLCVSCLLRDKIKKDPNFVANTGALASLSKGMDMTLMNYEGGSFSNVGMGDSFTGNGLDYDKLVVSIPEIKYTGPTNIIPKSVMNSILGATRAITNTTADVMVMGDMIMCYSTAKNGGAWRFSMAGVTFTHWTNIFMWIQGGIIWCLGFMLTVSIAYYLVDISFKMGFAVLAIPVMMGLWPFGMTQNKIFIAISIIAKSAAIFAFLALTTAFGMNLVGESVGGLSELYESMDGLTQGTTQDEAIKERVANTLYLFSPTFILLIFAILYFYKLVQQTISDLVNKFFPDQAFGDSSPMHSGATMATSYLKKMGMNISGANLVKDIAAHQAGRLVQGTLKKTGAVASYPLRHPMKSGRAVANGIKKGFNKLTGKK